MNILKIFKATNEEELDCLRGEEYMDEAIDEIRRICREHNIIGVYNAEKVANKVMNNRLDYAKQQGREEGIEKIAKNMLNEQANISFISKVTGLTKEQIEELKYIES